MLELYNKIRKIKYENDASASYIIIQIEEGLSPLNYQAEMIMRNKTSKILTPEIRFIDNSYSTYHDITSKMSLEDYLRRNDIKRKELIDILLELINTITNCKKLLLNSSSFVIHESTIFISPASKEISLVYLPFEMECDIDASIKRFITKLIIELASFNDEDSDNYIQRIIGCVKSETFKTIDLEKLLISLKDNKASNPIKENKALKENCDIILNTKPKADFRSEEIEEKAVRKVHRKNTIIIAILLQILFIATAVLLHMQLKSGSDSFDSVTTILGMVLIFGSIDFLILRKLLDKKNCVEAVINKDFSEDKKAAISNFEVGRNITNAFIQEKTIEADEATVLISDNIDKKRLYLEGTDSSSQEKILITKADFVIGRLKGQADYIISSNAVGRVHAEIITRECKYYIKDLNSRNGTKVNGERIISNTEHEIQSEDIIKFADKEYRFRVYQS